MKKIILLFLSLFPLYLFSQGGELAGTFTIYNAVGHDSLWTVTASFNSTIGFTASNIAEGDVVAVRYVQGSTHSRNLYTIDTITSVSGSSITVKLIRYSGVPTGYFPAGTHAIIRKISGTGLLPDPPNISQEIESYINNYNLALLKNADIISSVVRNDSVFVKYNSGDSLFVGAASGGGITNLSIGKRTTDTLSLKSSTGDSTLIPISTTSLAGLSSGADKTKLTNVSTSLTGDVAASINNGGAATSTIQAGVVTNAKLANMATQTIKGRTTTGTGVPEDLTKSQAQAILSVDDLITLSGVADGAPNLGVFAGDIITDSTTIKTALSELEVAVGNRSARGAALPSGQVFIGDSNGLAEFRTISGDANLSNTGVLTVTKQNKVLFIDEATPLGTTGTVDTLKFTGAAVTSTRSNNTVTINVTGGSTLASGKMFIGDTGNTATARTLSGDATIDTTGIVTVTKQNKILYIDETTPLGTSGTVDTVKFAGTGIVATRSFNTLTVTSSGGGGGASSMLTYQHTSSFNASNVTRVIYVIVSGSPIVLVTRTGESGATPLVEVTASGGEIRVIEVTDIYDNALGSAVSLDIKVNGIPANLYDAVPVVTKMLWNNTMAQGTPTSSSQYDIDNTPGVIPYGYTGSPRVVTFKITNIPAGTRVLNKFRWLNKDD